MKLTESTFIILDTETTALENPKVVEVAAYKHVFKRPFQDKYVKQTLVNPQCKINPAAMAVHHITDEYVKNAPTIKEVEKTLKEWIGDDLIMAYNSDFDKGVLSNTFLFENQWVDAYRMALHFWSSHDKNEDGFPLTSFKQQELRYWLHLSSIQGEAHRASADVQVTALILDEAIQKYLSCGNTDNFQNFIDYINSPIEYKTLPFGGRLLTGKRPSDISDWSLKKAFELSFFCYDDFKKFNVLDNLRPEYIKRFGREPPIYTENTTITHFEQQQNKNKSFQPKIKSYKKNQVINNKNKTISKNKWARR